jgi:hypothetical protein
MNGLGRQRDEIEHPLQDTAHASHIRDASIYDLNERN